MAALAFSTRGMDMHAYHRIEEGGQPVLVGREIVQKKNTARASAVDGVYVEKRGDGIWAVVQRRKASFRTLLVTTSEKDAEEAARRYNAERDDQF